MKEKPGKFNSSDTRKRILIVEDEIINREMLRESLCGTYDLVMAETGEEAMELICSQYELLSIVLLDLNLPGINGLDVLRQIKSNQAYSRLPVIVMTATGEAEVECLTLGAIDFIPKPYPPSEVILARIQRTVELSEDRDILSWTERDQLTGLYNREFFYRYAAKMDHHHKDRPTDAIVANINRFHTLNDRYGKARCDEILKQIAEKALEIVKEIGGIVCRENADMFMFYCPHCSDYESILESLSVYLEDGKTVNNRIRLRMGVYSDADKTLDIERRFDRAKMASDTVKDNLVHPIGIYDHSMREAEMLAEQLIVDFSNAIREKQFKVFYQPKFDVRPDKPVLCSAEALVRWKHPTLGMVNPGLFIPLFEKNGLIQELDQYVWSVAAAQISDWKKRLGVSLPVSVNASRVDLSDPEFAETFFRVAKENGLDTSDLLLEVTESAYTEKPEQIAEKVRQLRELGFRIEMDDFGTGYSSLSMLSYMPVDVLKLDMLFIRNAFKEQMDTRLLEAMIRLAKSFNIPTIAEGVETEEQMLSLKKMGCDIIQGYYFSRPLPADEFEKFIMEHINGSLNE